MSIPCTVTATLVSHTNAGKTTLARTLLAADVGEVRDAPHVTEFASEHVLLQSAAGDVLQLADTPGFGDSVRLLARLRRQGNPLGWFLSEVWDRWRDRAFWASQQALKQVRERTDVVLYLVNAAESPQAAAYVEPEMQLLQWVGAPVLVLLNQLGTPRAAAEEAADVERWRVHLARHAIVRDVLPLDAFARCWVQEGTLLRAIEAAFEEADERRGALARVHAAWAADRLATFGAAMRSLAQTVARAAAARQPLEGERRLSDAMRRLARTLRGDDPGEDAQAQAQAALAAALDAQVREGTARLIALHRLEGRAQGEVLARVGAMVQVQERVGEGRAAVLGGLVTGALAGLKADIATGGLTLGGGLLAGGLLGALGAAGLARGINVMRGGGPAWLGLSAEACVPLVEAALLRYLAVAHFGRGRGQWVEGEAPAHWVEVVREALAPQREALDAAWRTRSTRFDAPDDAARIEAQIEPLLAGAARAALERLYPGTWPDSGG